MYFMSGFFFAHILLALQPYFSLMLRGKGFSPAEVGVLLGFFEAAGIAGPFVFSFFADRRGRYKPPLAAAHLLLGVCLLPLALSASPLVTALAMAVMGASLRSIYPLFDAVCTISIGDAGDYGKLRTAGSVGYILMMLVLQFSPFLRPNSSMNVIYWVGIASSLSLGSILFIPSGFAPAPGRPKTAPETGGKPGKGFWSPLLVLGLLIIGLSRLSMVSINSYFSLFLVEYLRWDAVGLVNAVAASCEVPLMFLSKRLINRFGALPLLAVSAAAVALRLAIYTFLPYKGWIIAAQSLHSFCYGVFYPAGIAFIAGCVPPERRALGMSLFLSIGTGLPLFAGTILGGFIIQYLGYRQLYGIFSLFSVAALGIYLLIFLAKHRKSTV
jgi:PPP family 3-phenylpropionic acid transporter